MEIAPEQLEKFRALWRVRFGVEITPQEALERAIPLLTLMRAVYRPITEGDLKAVRERQASINQKLLAQST